jgi:hypothetical protein
MGVRVTTSAPEKLSATDPVDTKVFNTLWKGTVNSEVKTAFHVLFPLDVTPLISQVAEELQHPPVPLLVFRKVKGEPPGSGGVVVGVSVQVCPAAAAATLVEHVAGFPDPRAM